MIKNMRMTKTTATIGSTIEMNDSTIAVPVSIKETTGLRGHKDPKIMLTQDYIVLFYLEFNARSANLDEDEDTFDYLALLS